MLDRRGRTALLPDHRPLPPATTAALDRSPHPALRPGDGCDEARHAADLDSDLVWFRAHLVEDHVLDFCRRIGVPPVHIEGGGQDFAEDQLVRLIELP